MSSQSRTRTSGGFSLNTAVRENYKNSGAFVSSELSTASVGVTESMTDIVSKPFVAGKTFINTPMSKTRREQVRTPCTGRRDLNNPNDPGIAHVIGSRYNDRSASLSTLSSKLANYDPSPLISEAATSALAGVRKPEVNGLVALAEFKETVHSIRHPINGALKFLGRNAPSKRKRNRLSKRSLKASANHLADQHLTIIFGLLPFISDVQGTLKVIREAVKTAEPTVLTSHGQASSFDVVTSKGSSVIYNDGNNVETLYYDDECRRTVIARAYVLYRTKVDMLDALGLSPSEIPTAAWQTLTLSFVVDWFANVSKFISALTPRFNLEVLVAGYTTRITDVYQSLYSTKMTHSGSFGWSGSDSGGVHVDLVENYVRTPHSLNNLVGLHFKHNMHKDTLDTFKVTAAISLLTQRLSKYI